MVVYVMICVRPSGRVILQRDKNFNVTIFSDTINVINVKLCVIVLHMGLYLFIPLSVTLSIFQGHSNDKQFRLKFLRSYLIKGNFAGLLSKSSS